MLGHETFPDQLTHDVISAPHGQLEIITSPVLVEPKVCIICHPHPQHEGTMHNKVVTTLAKTCQNQGYATVRFNYRGVGQSTGEYGELIGEIDDLKTVLNWVNTVLPGVPITLAGFSFGSYISANVANQLNNIAWLISVAPAVHHADFETLNDVACPWLVVQGEDDEVVPPAEVYTWATENKCVSKLEKIADAGHFFHGKLVPLRHVVEFWIDAL